MLSLFTLLDNTRIACHAHANIITENDNSICYVLYRPFIPDSFIKISDRDIALSARIEVTIVHINTLHVARDMQTMSRHDALVASIDSTGTPYSHVYNCTDHASACVTRPY